MRKFVGSVMLAGALAGCAANRSAPAARAAMASGSHASASAPVQLRCMALKNPLAINAPRPRFAWRLPWKGQDRVQKAYQVLVDNSRQALASGHGNLWNSGQVRSGHCTGIIYSGHALHSGERAYWEVRAWSSAGHASAYSKIATFREGLRTAAAWHGAKWIGFAPTSPAGINHPLPAVYLRHTFSANKNIRRATIYLSGLGLSRLYVNGRPASHDQLSPALTWYPKRCDYLAFNVTKLMKRGANAVGVILGNGRMYGMPASYTVHIPPRMLFLLRVRYANGAVATLVSNATWKMTDNGPIRYDNEYNGETYDARKRMPAWDLPGFTAAGWKRARVLGPPGINTSTTMNVTARVRHAVHGNAISLVASNTTFGRDPAYNHVKQLRVIYSINGRRRGIKVAENQTLHLHGRRLRIIKAVYGAEFSNKRRAAAGPRITAQTEPPIRIVQTLHPVRMLPLGRGKWIYDMGQNMVGWCKIHAAGPAGTKITLRHAESLLPNGHLYTANLRTARATDTLILAGKPITWHPIFTYHGFRYVEVSGYPGKPSLSDLVGQEVHDPMRVTGGFVCSDQLVNQIVHNCFWGVQDNYRSIPTDCPQRDERQGWMGDRAQETLGEMFFFNNQAFYANWLRDIQDAQQTNGSISDVNPPYWSNYSNNVTWPSTFIFLPGSLYRQYGDVSVIARHYAAMGRWMRLMQGSISHGVISNDSYGDWCSPPRSKHNIHSRDPKRATPAPVLATTTLYVDAKDMAWYAKLLHRNADQRRYLALARTLYRGLNKQCWNREKGYYGNGSDTSCILPIAASMVPHNRLARVVARLKYRINQRQGGHTGCGAVGVQWQDRALSKVGLSKLAWSMLNQTTYPSFGYEIKHQATTVWELWNGNTANPAMNSQNHVMLIGDTVTWLFQHVAGIRSSLAQPGYKKIIMRPHLMPHLTFVNAWHRSRYGKITSDWKVARHTFTWHVTVPPDCTATLYIPTVSDTAIRLDGHPLELPQRQALRKGRFIVTVGSGAHVFSSRIK